ncbi:hypothetical protein N8I77_010137 [Diaporthe amygdali]|uniref:Uncharacterized protein n=1 Tax=Phomopsis amygdali TaxID=1214568 RepID=A0AAD9S7T0_PHOAM|nr:hypothetical protein N8I77_010137 [Diaporthe amygdali]
MLRRHSGKSKSDLHHRKSTTSVRSVHLEHIDAAIAQRDARTAAMEAFSRAQGRLSAESSLFPPQPASTSKANQSPGGLSRVDSTASLRSEDKRQGPGRRQSVRFVGPNSGLQTRSSRISMRTAVPEPPEIPVHRAIHRSQSAQSISSMPRSVLHNRQNLPLPDRTSSVGKTIVTPQTTKAGLSQAYLQALSPDYEQYTPEDDIASMPSSYRRVRKTRSMLTTRASIRRSFDENVYGAHGSSLHNTDSKAHHNQTPSAALFHRYPFMKRKDNRVMPSAPKLGAPKSMSFLKSRRDRPDKSSSCESPGVDASPVLEVQEASFRSRILPKPAKIFGSKSRETQQGMQKTLTSSSANGELPPSGTGSSLGRSRSGSLRNRARKVSTSLRSRFKNLFINKSEDETSLPAQQIEAQRTHVSEIFDENPWVSTITEHNHRRERSSLSKVSTRIPSLHAVPSHEHLHSRRGSIDSCKSAAGQTSAERSRVTSWASTESNTTIAHRSQEMTEEGEMQRLSIINENGFQDPSLSLTRPAIGLQTITSQEELAAPVALQCLPPGATVDSQRVYSALIKKMNETQQLAGIVEQQRKSSGGSDPFRTLSPSSSIGSDDSSDANQARLPRLQLPNSGGQAKEYSGHARNESDKAELSNKTIPTGVIDDHQSLSPPVQLTPRGGESVARTITDRGSAFFGSPTSHLFRTTSPFRRSLQEAMRAERGHTSSQAPKEATAGAISLINKSDTYSESNYSSDTLIHKTEMKQGLPSVQDFNTGDSREETRVFEHAPTYRPTGERQVSTASSIGWKTRLSADIAKLEQSPTRVSGQSPEVEYRIPTMPRSLGHGHVREAAQVGSCEEDEDNAKLSVRMPTNSTTPLSAIDSNVVKLSPQQRSVMRMTTPPAADSHTDAVPTCFEGKTSTSFYEDEAPQKLPIEPLRPRRAPFETDGLARNHRPAAHPQTPVRGHAVRQSKSLAGLKSISRIREPQTGSPQPPASSTIRLMRKSASKLALNSASSASSPGLTGAFERQFGSIGHHLGRQQAEKENQSPHEDDTKKQQSPKTKSQFRGSKAMVDLFLSNRRRQGAVGDADAFV